MKIHAAKSMIKPRSAPITLPLTNANAVMMAPTQMLFHSAEVCRLKPSTKGEITSQIPMTILIQSGSVEVAWFLAVCSMIFK